MQTRLVELDTMCKSMRKETMIFRLVFLFGLLLTFTFGAGASFIRERAADSSLLPSTRDSSYDTLYLNSSSTTKILQETSAISAVTGLTTSTISISPLSQGDQTSRAVQTATLTSPASRDNQGSGPSPEVTSTSSSSPGDQGTGPSQGTSSNSSASQNDHGGGLKKDAIIGIAIGIPSAIVAIGTIIGFLRKRM